MEKHQTNHQCTVLVNSCDEYQDLWEPFFELFLKFWSDCPYPIFLNTESKTYEHKGLVIDSLKHKNSHFPLGYGERLIECLDAIETPYVLILLDDYFIREKVNQRKISQIISWLDNNNEISCFNFDSIPDTFNTDNQRFEEFELRSKYGEYRYNLQGAIWRTESLREAWKKNETPWQWEVYGNIRSWQNGSIIYSLKSDSTSPINYGKKPGLTWGVVRGQWMKDDILPLFKSNGIKVDYEKRGFYVEGDNKMGVFKNKISKIYYSLGTMLFFKYLGLYMGWILSTKKSVSLSTYVNGRSERKRING